MACDFPIVCPYWNKRFNSCSYIGEFNPHPCETHQQRIDYAETEELRKENMRLKAEMREY